MSENSAESTGTTEQALYQTIANAPKRTRDIAIHEALAKETLPLETLRLWSRDPLWQVREAAVTGLHNIALEPAEETARLAVLYVLLEDEHWRVFHSAIAALAKYGDKDTFERLNVRLDLPKNSQPTLAALSNAMIQISLDGASLALALHALLPKDSNRTEHRSRLLEIIYEHWRDDHSSLEDFESFNLNSAQRKQANAYQPHSLPDWLKANETERFSPSLLRLHSVSHLQKNDVTELLMIRFRAEGCQPLHLYELLEVTRHAHHSSGWLANELIEFAPEAGPMLASWLPRLDYLRDVALFWLGSFGEHALDAVPTLFQMMLTGPKEYQGGARNTCHNIFHIGGARLEQGELFGYIREVLSHPINRNTWQILRMLLDRCVPPEHAEVAVDYIDAHLPEDARQQQSQFRTWVETLGGEKPTPFLCLIRHLRLATLFKRYPQTSEVVIQALSCPYIKKLTHLDLEEVELSLPLIEGLAGLAETQAPQGITHLYLTRTQLTPRRAALLLSHLALPKLTHLYMANNPMQAELVETLAEHPVIEQLEMLNLKRSFGPDAFLRFVAVADLSSMRKLNISDSNLTHDCIEALLNANTLQKGCLIDARRNSIETPAPLMDLAREEGIELMV